MASIAAGTGATQAAADARPWATWRAGEWAKVPGWRVMAAIMALFVGSGKQVLRS
ncbi:MAG: hypothetical protein K2Y51_24085 [Gammaproteobacteria bacterium]|nr:hypothetical protein [Gammaproteobacteria bacterium]